MPQGEQHGAGQVRRPSRGGGRAPFWAPSLGIGFSAVALALALFVIRSTDTYTPQAHVAAPPPPLQ